MIEYISGFTRMGQIWVFETFDIFHLHRKIETIYFRLLFDEIWKNETIKKMIEWKSQRNKKEWLNKK